MLLTLGSVDRLAAELFDALTSGFSPFVADRLVALGVEPAGFDPAIDEGLQALRQELEELLAIPYSLQPASPLQVVRRCLRPVIEALIAAGVAELDRDAGQERVAPDDPYDLGPTSAAELGEAALRASVAWGAAKAMDASRPLALVVTSNLMDVARFESAASRAGYRFASAEPGSVAGDPLVAFVDLEGDGAEEAIASLAGAGVRVIGYGPHVDDMAMVRARALGASDAEPRSRVLRDPGAYLPPLV